MKEVFIVGPARSGTTIFGETLSKVMDCEYWLEPKYLWKYKNFNLLSDVLTSADLTPDIARYIKKRIAQKLNHNNNSVYLDKTPSHVFRIPFIRAVFPDCFLVFIERDPIDTILSAEKKWNSSIPRSVFWRRFKNNDLTIVQLFKLLGFIFFKRRKLWGPVSKNVVEAAETDVLFAATIQYAESISYMNAFTENSSTRIIRIHYEEFIENPEKVLSRVLKFIDEPIDKNRIRKASKSVQSNPKSHSDIDRLKFDSIKQYLKDG